MPKGIFLAADVGEKSYFSSARSQHSSEARPHAMTPREQQKCIKQKNLRALLNKISNKYYFTIAKTWNHDNRSWNEGIIHIAHEMHVRMRTVSEPGTVWSLQFH